MSFTSVLSSIPAPVSFLQAPPGAVAGNGWEVWVLSSADYATVLTAVPRYETWQFAKMLNDKGSGSITIKADDAIFLNDLGDGNPGNELLDNENLWQFWLNGRLVFDFLGETVTEQLVDQSEEVLVTVTGPGTIATLAWALAMPPGFPTVVFKTDSISDTFSEVDTNGNPALDLTLWNLAGPLGDITLNPLGNFNASGLTFSNANPFGAIEGSCQLTATSGGTVLAGGPFDITNSVISAQVAPMFGTAGLDGSQVTQMYVQNMANSSFYALIGLSATEFYAQLSDTTGAKTKVLGSYDSSNDAYWMITEVAGYFFFWASSDGQSWTELWSVPHHFDATNISVNFAAIYDSGGQSVGISNINSNVTVPTTVGNIYLEMPVMSIWHNLLTTAQARGTIPFLTTRLNATNDSFLNPWTDKQSAQIANGTDLYSLLQTCASIIDADFRMQPGFNLQVGLPLSQGGGTSLGQDLSRQIIFHEGREVLTKTHIRARDQIQTLIGAVNQDGTVVSATQGGGSSGGNPITQWGQREGWITTGAQLTPEGMAVVAASSVEASSQEQETFTLTIRPDEPGHVALQDFDAGDWVGLERPFFQQASSVTDVVRVIGVAYAVDPQGLVTCELTLVSYRQWLEEQLQYIANKFGGQFVSALGATLLTAVPVQQRGLPFVINPDLGGLTDVTIA